MDRLCNSLEEEEEEYKEKRRSKGFARATP